jgi:hypothetical protein
MFKLSVHRDFCLHWKSAAAHMHNFGQFYVAVARFTISAKIGISLLESRHGCVRHNNSHVYLLIRLHLPTWGFATTSQISIIETHRKTRSKLERLAFRRRSLPPHTHTIAKKAFFKSLSFIQTVWLKVLFVCSLLYSNGSRVVVSIYGNQT